MIKLLPKSDFAKNVLVLMTGTSISQLIPFLVSPILTRLYSPDEFGIFAFYLSIVAVVSIIATGRYEQAIILPKKEWDAESLLQLSIGIAFVMSLLLLVCVHLLGKEVAELMQRPELAGYLYYVPLTVFLMGAYQSLRFMNNRRKQYLRIASSRMVESSTNAGVGVVTGFMSVGTLGLIAASALSTLVGILNLYRGAKRQNNPSKMRVWVLAGRYSKFPKVDVFSALFNSAAQQAPNFLFAPLFGAAFAGYYFLIQRVFLMPIKLLSTSIAEVFRQEAAKKYNDTNRFDELFISTFKKLSVFAVIPFSILMISGEWVFGLVFGAEWAIAGYYAQILAPMFMLKFIVSPLTYAFYVVGKLHYNFFGQAIYFFALIGSISLGYIKGDLVLTIKMISLTGSLFYTVYFFISYRFSKGVVASCSYKAR